MPFLAAQKKDSINASYFYEKHLQILKAEWMYSRMYPFFCIKFIYIGNVERNDKQFKL
jgi:hypothetical protein